MDNKEDILCALQEFEEKSVPTDEVPEILERYIRQVAKTGIITFEWDKMKSLFLHKLNLTMIDFFEKFPSDHLVPSPNVEDVKFEEMKNRILDTTAKFTGAPFTIQRLCELATNPQNHYQRTDKFLRGLEKNLNVVSSVDLCGNKIVCEPKLLFNGTESNGMETGQLRTPEKVNSPFLPPAPNNSPTPAASLFSGTPTCSPSPLTHSWPREGSGEALADIGPSTESSMSMLRAHTQPSTWDSEFEGYLLPEKKKPRLDNTVTSLGNSRKSSDIPESMPSVSEVFAMHKLTTSPLLGEPPLHGSSACQFSLSSVIKERTNPAVSSSEPGPSVPVSASPVFNTSTSSSLVSSSESVPTMSTPVTQTDTNEVTQSSMDSQVSEPTCDSALGESSKCDVDTTSEASQSADCSDAQDQVDTDSQSELPGQSQSSDVSDSSSFSGQADHSDIDGEPMVEQESQPCTGGDYPQTDAGEQLAQAEPSGIEEDESEDLAMEPETNECEPREQIEPQPLEDGVDRRDSQGFDVSPNPEEMSSESPQSEPDSCPVPEPSLSPRPDPNVTSSSESTPVANVATADVLGSGRECEVNHDQDVPTAFSDVPAPDDAIVSNVASSSEDGDSRMLSVDAASTAQDDTPSEASSENQCQSSDAPVCAEDDGRSEPATTEQSISQSTDEPTPAVAEHQAMETD